MRDHLLDGKVDSIYSNNIDFLARISVRDIPKTILPGMTADVAIILEKKENALLFLIASLDGSEAPALGAGKEERAHVVIGLNAGHRFQPHGKSIYFCCL